MKKFFSIILAVLTITGVGLIKAEGADYTDSDNIKYTIDNVKVDNDCWYNAALSARTGKLNTGSVTIRAKATAGATAITTGVKIIAVTLPATMNITNSGGGNQVGNVVTFTIGNNVTLDANGTALKITVELLEMVPPVIYSASGTVNGAGSFDGASSEVPIAKTPTVTTPINPNMPIHTFDNTKIGIYSFNSGVQGVSGNQIGWTEAVIANNPMKIVAPSEPDGTTRFVAQNDSVAYQYTYTYTTTDGCVVDTALYANVWIKKGYKPEIKNAPTGASAIRTSYDTTACTGVYKVSPLPWVADINDQSNIDVVQIDSVWRVVANISDSKTYSIPLAYSAAWKNDPANTYDTITLKDGKKYDISYKFRYKYASADSTKTCTFTKEIPFRLDAIADLDTVKTDSAMNLYVLRNDTISKCLGNDFTLQIVGNPTHGTATVKGSGSSSYIEYKSSANYQGPDNFTYKIVDGTTYSILPQQQSATVTATLRVEPVYALSVDKVVTRIGSYKGARTTGMLDNLLTGDTVYFKITVKNTGKNNFTNNITVRDTFPSAMVNPDDLQNIINPTPAGVRFPTPDGNFGGRVWTINQPFNVGATQEITFGLLEYNISGNFPLADSNKVNATVTMPKYSATPAEGNVTIVSLDTVPLRIFENTDIKVTKKADRDNLIVINTPMSSYQDKLVADSMHQPVLFIVEARNIGKTPLKDIEIGDKLPNGIIYKSADFYILDNKANTGAKITDAGKQPNYTTPAGVHTWTWNNSQGIRIGQDSSIRIYIHAEVNAVDTFRNVATAKDNAKTDIDFTDNADTAMVVFKPTINLTVTKNVVRYGASVAISQGDTVVYTITVQNEATSSTNLHNIAIRDTMPKQLQEITGMNDTIPAKVAGNIAWTRTTTNPTDTSFVWTIPYLAKGKSATLRFYMRAAKKGNSINNTAYAVLPVEYYADSAVAKDNVLLTIASGLDLDIRTYSKLDPSRQQSADTYVQGDTVTLLLVVRNNSDFENETIPVTVNVEYPDNRLVYSSSHARYATPYNNATKVWTIPAGRLNMAQSDTLWLRLIANDKDFTGVVNPKAYLFNYPAILPEFISNDTAKLTVNIIRNTLDLSAATTGVNKNSTYLTTGTGATVGYTITLAARETAINNITLADTLPKGTLPNSWSTTTTPAYTKVDSSSTWAAGVKKYILIWENNLSVPASGTTPVNVTCRVNALGKYGSGAGAKCTGLEATLLNNYSSDTVTVSSRVDLAASLTASAKHSTVPNVLEGDTVIYKLRMAHTAGSVDNATNITATFRAPSASLKVLGVKHGNTTIPYTAGVITVTGINVALGRADSVEVMVRVEPNASQSGGGVIDWRAYINSNDDVQYSNDTANVSITATTNTIDLQLTYSPTPLSFPISQSGGAPAVVPFTYTLQINNLRGGAATGVVVTDTLPKGLSFTGPTVPPVTSSATLPNGSTVLRWTISTFPSIINISSCTIPYDSVHDYVSRAAVRCNELDADPENNAKLATAKIINDVDLAIDSVVFYKGAVRTNMYKQGDVVTARVYLSNLGGITAGANVEVKVNNTNGFTVVNNPVTLTSLRIGAPDPSADYVDLKLSADTITPSITWSITATNGSGVPSVSKTSSNFLVDKGADPKVWVKVNHTRNHYSHLNYVVAITNMGQYRSDTVGMQHVVPVALFNVDSIRTNKGTYSYNATNGNLAWKVSRLNANHTDTAYLTVYVTSQIGSTGVSGSITCSNDYDLTNNNFNSATIVVEKNPYNVAVTKTADAREYNGIDKLITYTINVSNIGDSTAYEVKMFDRIPTNLVLQLQGTYHYTVNGKDLVQEYISSGNVDSILWTIDTLRKGESYTMTLKARATEANRIVNTASLTVNRNKPYAGYFDEDDFNNNTSSDTIEMYSTQNIGLTFITSNFMVNPATSRDVFTQGDTILFTIRASASAAEKVLGAEVTLLGFPDRKLIYKPGWYQAAAGSSFNENTFTWSIPTLDKGTYKTLELIAIVGDSTPIARGMIDSVMANLTSRSTNKYYRAVNATAAKTAYITYCDFDLKVEKKVSPLAHAGNAAYADETFGYSITVSNMREAAVDSIVLIDVLPAGINFSGITVYPPYSSFNPATRVMRWDNLVRSFHLDSLSGGESREIVVQGCSAPVGSYLNSVQVVASKHESSLANNTDTATASVIDAVALGLTFTSESETFVKEGSTFVLNLTITNTSESEVSDLSIATAAIPATLSFVSSPNGTFDAATGIFSWLNTSGVALAPDSSITIKLTVQAKNNGNTSWTANLYLSTIQKASATLTLAVTRNDYNVALTKTASQPVFYMGFDVAPYNFNYQIVATNTRDSALANVVVRDTLPAGIDINGSIADATISTYNGRQVVTFNAINLAKTASQTFTIPCNIVRDDSMASYLNRAYVTCSAQEAITTDNVAGATVDVRNEVNLKVNIALQQGGAPLSGNHQFKQGDVFDVQVSVLNNGRIANTTPVNVVIGAAANLFTIVSGPTFTPNPIATGALTPNTPLQQLVYSVRAEQTGAFSFGASANTVYNSLILSDTATVQGNIAPGADMRTWITVAQAASNHSKQRSYTVHMQNVGQYTARAVALTHTLPSALTLDSVADANGKKFVAPRSINDTLNHNNLTVLTYQGSDFMLSMDTVAAGSSTSFTVYTTVKAWTPADSATRIMLYANVSGTAANDYSLGNNHAAAQITVYPNPFNVSISITPQKKDIRNVPDEMDKSVVYTITASNLGIFPADSVYVSYNIKQNGLVIKEGGSGKSKTWYLPQLHSNSTQEFTLTVEPESSTSKGRITSIAQIKVDEQLYKRNEADTTDNRDETYVTLYSWLDSWPIMEAFSPNGDGKNDQFVIKDLVNNSLVDRAELVIVNRYGSEVYYSKSYDNSWDGGNLAEGTYFYRLTVYFTDGSSDKRSGFINLRRSKWKN